MSARIPPSEFNSAPFADLAPAGEINQLIGDLADAQSRKRIVAMWTAGWIDGDTAMEALIACDLIEATQ